MIKSKKERAESHRAAQARYQDKRRQAGLVEVRVWLTRQQADQVRALAEKMSSPDTGEGV